MHSRKNNYAKINCQCSQTLNTYFHFNVSQIIFNYAHDYFTALKEVRIKICFGEFFVWNKILKHLDYYYFKNMYYISITSRRIKYKVVRKFGDGRSSYSTYASSITQLKEKVRKIQPENVYVFNMTKKEKIMFHQAQSQIYGNIDKLIQQSYHVPLKKSFKNFPNTTIIFIVFLLNCIAIICFYLNQ